MGGHVTALCILSALVGASLAFLIMHLRIERLKESFRRTALTLVAEPPKAKRSRRSPFIQTISTQERTAQLRADLMKH